MKLKSILSMCAKSKTILTVNGEDHQWIGTGFAMYKICGLPRMDADALLTLMDVQKEKRTDYYCREEIAPDGYNLDDFDEGESLLERGTIRLILHGRELEPMQGIHGINYLDTGWLKPFGGDARDIYERRSESGQSYFVVKAGMLIEAVIMPYRAFDKNLLERLESIVCMTRAALDAVDEKQQEQMTL